MLGINFSYHGNKCVGWSVYYLECEHMTLMQTVNLMQIHLAQPSISVQILQPSHYPRKVFLTMRSE